MTSDFEMWFDRHNGNKYEVLHFCHKLSYFLTSHWRISWHKRPLSKVRSIEAALLFLCTFHFYYRQTLWKQLNLDEIASSVKKSKIPLLRLRKIKTISLIKPHWLILNYVSFHFTVTLCLNTALATVQKWSLRSLGGNGNSGQIKGILQQK